MHKLLLHTAAVLAVAFVFFVVMDYIGYSEFNSAPFSTFVLVRAIQFLLPALFLAILGLVLHKKNK